MFCHICGRDVGYDKRSFKQHHLDKIHSDITEKEYYDKYILVEGENICEVCNKETTFYSVNRGYARMHKECISKSKDVRTKRKTTNIDKYGKENPSQVDFVKEKKRETTLKNYGVLNPSQSNEVKDRKAKTTLKNYGVLNPLSLLSIRNDTRSTDSINKAKLSRKYNKEKEYVDIACNNNLQYLDYSFGNSSMSYVKYTCNKCGKTFDIQKQLLQKRIKSNTEICIYCNNIKSLFELEVKEFIINILGIEMIHCEVCKQDIANNKFSEHLKIHNIDSIERYALDILGYSNKCKNKGCSNTTSFLNLKRGFRDFCSINCSNIVNSNSATTKEKIKETNLKLYGGHHSNNALIREKTKNTRLNKLIENPSLKDAINLKRKNTCIERYGVEFSSQSRQYKDSINRNTIEKYEALTNSKVIEKIDSDYYLLNCNICLKDYKVHRLLIKNRNDKNINICTNCLKKHNYSAPENELANFFRDENVIINDRKVLNGKELDIYLPELNIAFEFNGLYWHSELHREKDYHLNKTEKCSRQGIHLIQIYEDDWLYKKDIVKSRIRNILNKSERIYARKCIIKTVNNSLARQFLEENHIQGKINSQHSYGLYYNDELVSLMTFGKNRFRKNKNIELLRFCNKLNISVIGGASRLFKHAIKENGWDEVISYADRSWSNGNLYRKLGFEEAGVTPPNYYYINNHRRENRFKYRKSELIRQGYPADKTEKEIMFNAGFYRIYDSGSLIFIWKSI